MLPWCNRIKGGLLRFDGQTYQLRTTKDDGTARHGDVRGRAWRVDQASATSIRMSLRSDDYPDINWPFRFSAVAEYALDERYFNWTLALKNEDERPFPAGFGHHPYFVKPEGAAAPQVQIPCDKQFELVDFLAVAAPIPVKPELDFREGRSIDGLLLNDLLTGRTSDIAATITYPNTGIHLVMQSDDPFEHILIFAPEGKPFFAVEPMSNANDGFNLFADGVPGGGVFVLQPGEEQSGVVNLKVELND
jgi:aldose 1-epimerase